MSSDSANLFVVDPNPNDVLCGRGRSIREHPGNQVYLSLVNEFRSRYMASLKGGKMDVVQEVVDVIRNRGGRFLRREGENWCDIGDKKAMCKTSQAFRDLKIKEDGDEDEDNYNNSSNSNNGDDEDDEEEQEDTRNGNAHVRVHIPNPAVKRFSSKYPESDKVKGTSAIGDSKSTTIATTKKIRNDMKLNTKNKTSKGKDNPQCSISATAAAATAVAAAAAATAKSAQKPFKKRKSNSLPLRQPSAMKVPKPAIIEKQTTSSLLINKRQQALPIKKNKSTQAKKKPLPLTMANLKQHTFAMKPQLSSTLASQDSDTETEDSFPCFQRNNNNNEGTKTNFKIVTADDKTH